MRQNSVRDPSCGISRRGSKRTARTRGHRSAEAAAGKLCLCRTHAHAELKVPSGAAQRTQAAVTDCQPMGSNRHSELLGVDALAERKPWELEVDAEVRFTRNACGRA